MIISAYQGVGKSTLAKTDLKIIDLESSSFDKASPNWYIDYCRVAMNLDKQGYIVFISSHKSVRDYLKSLGFIKYYMIMFAENTENSLIERLKERYDKSDSDKDYRAYMNAKMHFKDSLKEIADDKELNTYWITDMNYSLKDIISLLEEKE